MIKVAAAIIIKDKKLLLVKQKNRDYWTPPGGLVDKGETFEEACIRETKEEVGVEVEIVAPLQTQRRWWAEKQREIEVYNFLTVIKSGEPHCVDNGDIGDVEDIAWVQISELNSYGVPSGTDKLFLEALAKL